jgi:energy-coupling factor transporter ATP-binding protein EcfA2
VLFCWDLLQSELLSPLTFMLKSLKIENFRGFESFELKQLGRINLLVGENNSGKTSILEAIQLLTARNNLEPLSRLMIDRGEFIENSNDQKEIEIRHLFYGHALGRLMISGENGAFKESLSWGMRELFPVELAKLYDEVQNELLFNWSSEDKNGEPWTLQHFALPLSQDDTLSIPFNRIPRIMHNPPVVKTQFISATSVSIPELFRFFEDVQLTPQEDLVYQALRTIEPKCERIAGKTTHRRFEVKLSDQLQPIPLGSMGDGMSRILRLALGLANAQGGILLVDEIDTGLHFTTMTGMWKMLWEAAKQLDVQIFATTHSRDCWESLAEVAESESVQDDAIVIHRVEKRKTSSVIFNPHQMAIAVEERLEVR